ncbi:MAG: DUF1501 domain-containing protein [Xanthomonadales bacterium]|nr:DUF1501 domain-containing protein [Gammaproteobacteria bacterium]NND57613.1 DUF1501 domain-containing protein [Xanthomonadales bacterium]
MKSFNNAIDRRTFLRQSISASLAAAVVAGKPGLLLAQDQACIPQDMPRTLVNVMLQGGADFRYLFMPSPGHPDTEYLSLLWSARRSLYSEAYANYEQMFDNEYLLTADPLSGQEFGIHSRAAWLHSQFNDGRLAIVANAYCGRNRRHDQSILNADAGEPDYAALNFDRDGWGGRLVEQLGGTVNTVELGNSVTTFNKGTVQGNRLARVLHAQDMRSLALPEAEAGAPASRRSILARALRAYYEARGPEVSVDKPGSWPYHTFFQHNTALRTFAAEVDAKLASCIPLPDELLKLQLSNPDFAQQARNLFDVCQVPSELSLGVVSMSYGGWDTHNNQAAEIGSNLADVFGRGGGLDTAMTAIETLPAAEQPASGQLVFYFASDFGRQLIANGAAGTDHGSGTYSMLLGHAVCGGVYGEMFPLHESRPDSEGRIPLQTPGADIEGLTSTDRILSEAVDWVGSELGAGVFPDSAQGGLEPGVSLASLFAG